MNRRSIGIGLVLALSLLGDAIRDAFDPKTRR
jgi:ABC-type dipeptide/oligopeptide/nickel transport system permease subunit